MVADDTQWIYKYDEQGNRIGLIEVPVVEPTHSPTSSHSRWFDDIEDTIISNEQWCKVSPVISQFDEWVHKLEIEALRYSEKNGFQPSVMYKTVYDIYFTESGDKKTTKTVLYTQNWKWINNYIQRRLLSRGMRYSHGEIRQTLHDISQAHMASEMRRVPVTVQISDSLRHRLEKVG